MRLFEHEAKTLFARFGIPVPEGVLARTENDAIENGRRLGLPLVLKAQVLTGGRGKAGGIKIVSDEGEVVAQAENLLTLKIKGYPVSAILIERALDIAHEYYLGITINRADYKIAIIASECGGVDIEKVAEENPGEDSPYRAWHKR